MSRYFAAPVLATMLALVGIRLAAQPPPAPDPVDPLSTLVVALPQDEPAARPEPPPPAPPPPPMEPPKAAPAPAPVIIVLEPLPQPAPVARPEVVERVVPVPQPTTVIYAPTTIYAPVIETAPPQQEGVELPFVVTTNPGLSPWHPPGRHPNAPCAAPKQEKFFKDIPFLPPTPKGPRWSP